MPEELVAILLTACGSFLSLTLLGAEQLSASRRWQDSDIPQNAEVERRPVTSIVAVPMGPDAAEAGAEAGASDRDQQNCKVDRFGKVIWCRTDQHRIILLPIT